MILLLSVPDIWTWLHFQTIYWLCSCYFVRHSWQIIISSLTRNDIYCSDPIHPGSLGLYRWHILNQSRKAMVIKHIFVSNHTEYEMHSEKFLPLQTLFKQILIILITFMGTLQQWECSLWRCSQQLYIAGVPFHCTVSFPVCDECRISNL